MSLPCRPQKCSAPDEHVHVAHFRRSLRGNQLGDKGWTALFKALCENKGDKTESWDLSGEPLPGVGPETAKALAEYISVSPALKSVECARRPAQCVQTPMNTSDMPHLGARWQAQQQQYRRGGRQGDRRRAQGLSAVYAGVRCYPKSTLTLYASHPDEHF